MQSFLWIAGKNLLLASRRERRRWLETDGFN